MKNLLVTVAILLTVTAARADVIDDYIEVMKDKFVSCAKEIGIAGQSPREIFDKDTTTGVDKASCLRTCTLKSIGNIQDSKFIVENINDVISSANAARPETIKPQQEISTKCIEKAKDTADECKMGYIYIQCFIDNLGK